ncbi:aldolase [Smithella sp. SC_K08D17]|nr:aldolase [Smithella sp. SC_K08D17]
MEFIYITNDKDLARYAQYSDVDRIMIDLETIGKIERQGHLNTVISEHSLNDINLVRNVLHNSKLQVRVNPMYPGSEIEINEVISRGADIIMLPMFKTCLEVERFISIIDGRVDSSLLLETSQALVRIDDILSTDCIDEVHIGLNDLHLSMGLDFMFELLSGGIVEYMIKKIKSRGIRYGFGGISRFGTGIIDPRLILSEHVRLGSQMVILSREFHAEARSLNELVKKIDLKYEIDLIRSYISYLSGLSENELLYNKRQIYQLISKFITLNARTENP